MPIVTIRGGTSGGKVEWAKPELFVVTQTIIDNNSITLTSNPLVNSEIVTLNGLVMKNNAGWDYTLLNDVVNFTSNVVLTIGDIIEAKYIAE